MRKSKKRNLAEARTAIQPGVKITLHEIEITVNEALNDMGIMENTVTEEQADYVAAKILELILDKQ